MSNYCGDCGEVMSGRGKCSCGWEAEIAATSNHMCSYRDGARACPRPGVMSKSVTGGDKWLCLNHFNAIGYAAKCIEILDEYEANPEEVPYNWREQAIQDYDKRLADKARENAA